MLHSNDPSLPLVRDFEPLLQTKTMGRLCKAFAQVGSTNTLALAWAREGAPEGSLVITDHQTQGRGRLDRRWETEPGQNLLFSLILRPALAPTARGQLMMAASVAVSDAIQQFVAPHTMQIKWPNDLLLNDKKCCGILMESPALDGPVVLGVGINVNQTHFDLPLATSLLLETGQRVNRAALLAEIMRCIEINYQALCSGETHHLGTIHNGYMARMAYRDRRVSLQLRDSAIHAEGIVEGVSELGGLKLRSERGVEIHFAGEVARTHIEV